MRPKIYENATLEEIESKIRREMFTLEYESKKNQRRKTR